ncbi:MAG TPA: hypothetical protein VF262_04140 [Burkholderiales bacterium]
MTIGRLLASLVFAASMAAAVPAQAQLRSIPPEARTGTIQHLQDMYVAIDGARRRLAPGAQIRDANNRLVLPAAIPPGAMVKYVGDAEGFVRQVWILTPQEAAQDAQKR